MRCERCGTTGEGAFCSRCGTPLGTDKDPSDAYWAASPPPTTPPPGYPPPPSPRKGTSWPVAIAAALLAALLVLGIGGGALWWLASDDEDSAATTETTSPVSSESTASPESTESTESRAETPTAEPSPSESTTTVTSTTTSTSDTPGPTDAGDPAEDQLGALRDDSLARLTTDGRWAVSLSAKQDGTRDERQFTSSGSHVFRLPDILELHEMYDSIYSWNASVYLVKADDIGASTGSDADRIWMTVVDPGLASRDDAEQWCQNEYPWLSGEDLDNACYPLQLDIP